MEPLKEDEKQAQICTKCGEEKNILEFYIDYRRGTRYRRCKTCCRKQNNLRYKDGDYYKKNRERIDRDNQKWREKNKEKVAAYQSRWRKENYIPREQELYCARMARAHGCEGFHTTRDFLRLVHRFNGKCAYCGINPVDGRDHVVPNSKGGSNYIGNVLPACQFCNSSKSNKLLVEWRYREDTRFKRWCF